MVQEAWILSLLCPNVAEQTANHLLCSEFRGNTEDKIKFLSTSTSQHFALVCTFSYSIELGPSTVAFTAPSSCKFSETTWSIIRGGKKTSVTRNTLNEHLLIVSESFGFRFAANKTQLPLCSQRARRVTPRLRLRRPLDVTAASHFC